LKGGRTYDSSRPIQSIKVMIMSENLENRNSLIPHKLNDAVVEQRSADGYVNATAFCRASGKLWGHYAANSATQAFVRALEADIGIPISELVQSVKGGEPQLQGTWVHPQIAVNLAQWVSPEFAVKVSKWVYDWMNGRQPAARMPTHLETAKQLVASLEREEAQKEKIEHMQPYYDGAKRMQVAEGSIGLREAADRLKVKLAKLTALLCEWQLCYRDQGGRLRHHAKFGMPRDGAASKFHGYFCTEGNTQVWENGRVVDRSYIVITPKGLEVIARKLGPKDEKQISLL
jgi:hypothetical protein